MSKLTELIKQYNLTTEKSVDSSAYRNDSSYGKWNQPPNPAWLAKRDQFIKAYGRKLQSEERYVSATIKCNEDWSCSHSIYPHGEAFAYSWPGQNYLVSKILLPLDVLHEVIKVKKEELEAARKKRFETIKSPRDAIRLIFRDLGIKVQMVSGSPRLDIGPCDIEFSASKDDSDPKVEVSFIYRSGDYKNEIALTTLTIADPNFSKKVEAIVFNGQNLNKLMLGEVQPKSLESIR